MLQGPQKLAMVDGLTSDQLDHVRFHWSLTARPEQRPPDPDVSLRLFLGGRGAGKTFAGAGWINDRAQGGERMALIGPTLHDVREVMVEGPSGILALAPDRPRPRWESSRRRLVWPNGAVAYAFSAEDPDSLRGPQFHAAWADELCAWRQPEKVLANLRLGLRLGARPGLLVTTTPRPVPALRALMAEPDARVDRAPTSANAEHLAPGFIDGLKALYGGTSLEAQEMEGLVVEGDGALFRADDLARARRAQDYGVPAFEWVVVAVDPPITAGGDACGIVAVGRAGDRAFVIADASARGLSPLGWARRVAETARKVGADLVLAEANQGGEMVRSVLAQAECDRPIKLVHASRGKRARAEPVAALYEQGRVIHCGAFTALEEELMALGSEDGPRRSPDRADALVWAVTELMLGTRAAGPRVRAI
jgi:phage terminase large subunit-like protein